MLTLRQRSEESKGGAFVSASIEVHFRKKWCKRNLWCLFFMYLFFFPWFRNGTKPPTLLLAKAKTLTDDSAGPMRSPHFKPVSSLEEGVVARRDGSSRRIFTLWPPLSPGVLCLLLLLPSEDHLSNSPPLDDPDQAWALCCQEGCCWFSHPAESIAHTWKVSGSPLII